MSSRALGGTCQCNSEQAEHGQPQVPLLPFLATSDFWFQSLRNDQSEFMALRTVVALTIFLQQKNSPHSKEVEAP